MKKIIYSTLFALFLISSVSAQKLTESKLLRTWTFGNEDWYEFMYKILVPADSYFEDDKNGKLIARICTKDKFTDALVKSTGFAYLIDQKLADFYTVPFENVYFATSSKCQSKSGRLSEEYWFVPENQEIEFDEILSAKNVSVKRFITSGNNADSLKKFNNDILTFIQTLKNQPAAIGYVIESFQNKKVREKLKLITKALEKGKIDLARVKFIRNTRSFKTYFPEMMSVSIEK